MCGNVWLPGTPTITGNGWLLRDGGDVRGARERGRAREAVHRDSVGMRRSRDEVNKDEYKRVGMCDAREG